MSNAARRALFEAKICWSALWDWPDPLSQLTGRSLSAAALWRKQSHDRLPANAEELPPSVKALSRLKRSGRPCCVGASSGDKPISTTSTVFCELSTDRMACVPADVTTSSPTRSWPAVAGTSTPPHRIMTLWLAVTSQEHSSVWISKYMASSLFLTVACSRRRNMIPHDLKHAWFSFANCQNEYVFVRVP